MSESKEIKTTFKCTEKNGVCGITGHPDVAVGSLSAAAEDKALWSPPAMMLAATESCFYLTLQILAEKMRVGIKSYSSEATGTISYPDGKHGEFTEVTIKPSIELEDEAQRSKLDALFRMAEEHCYVARSLKCPVKIEY